MNKVSDRNRLKYPDGKEYTNAEYVNAVALVEYSVFGIPPTWEEMQTLLEMLNEGRIERFGLAEYCSIDEAIYYTVNKRNL